MNAKQLNKSSKGSSSGSGQTMDDLLKMYGTPVHGYQMGDKVKGKVIEKTPKRLVVDIGGKSEGIVAEKAFNESINYIRKLNIGDEIEASVIVPETSDGYTILSLRTASEGATWSKLEKASEDNEAITVEGRAVTPSGIMVSFEGMMGFIPNSQLGREIAKNSVGLVGKRFKVAVIDIDRETNKVVLSERAVSEAEDIQLQERALGLLEIGDKFEGAVTTLYDFGAFVRIDIIVEGEEVPIEGLVHISELSWDKVDHTKELLKVGQKVQVVVIGKKDGKLSLSMKQTQNDPWHTVVSKYTKDAKVSGKVVRTSDFGMFVQLEPGVEGLVHMTKIPPGKKFKEGEEVNVYIEEVDPASRKISLGLVLTAKPVGYR